MRSLARVAGCITAALFAVACGNPPPKVKPTATASAGQAATYSVGDVVRLDGSASTDPGGAGLTFMWGFLSVPSGSKVEFNDASMMSPYFVPDKAGDYELRLIVKNAETASDPAQVSVKVSAKQPVARIKDDVVRPGTMVTLDGSESTSFSNSPLTFKWTVKDPQSLPVTLLNKDSARPSFRAELLGAHAVELTVNDDPKQDPKSDSTVAKATVFVSYDLNKPVANAGEDQTVGPSDTVTLSAAGSFTTNLKPATSEFRPLTYAWTLVLKPSGSTATLANATTQSPTFTADKVGLYRARLVVNDGLLSSEPDFVAIDAVDTNQLPVANAGSNFVAPIGTAAALDGSASYDPEGMTLTYAWSFTSKPTGSAATLTGANTVSPSFTPDVSGIYRIKLVVTDMGMKQSAPALVEVTAFDPNGTPVANAGPSFTAPIGKVVNLNGSASYDPENQALTYEWTFVSIPTGSTSILTGASTATPSFTPDKLGMYRVKLVVTDTGGKSSTPAVVDITVIDPNQPPVAVAGNDLEAAINVAVSMNGSASYDPEGTALAFAWSFISVPTGSTATLTGAGSATPSFTPDRLGIYRIRLVVTDFEGKSSAPAFLEVLVFDPNQAPTANAGSNFTAPKGKLVTLNGTGSFDPEGTTLTYAWSFISIPTGSTATLSGAATDTVTFTPDLVGIYRVKLVVTDAGGKSSSPATVDITATDPNRAPVANTGGALSANLNAVVNLNGSASYDPDGQALTYAWSFVTIPAGSTAILTGAITATPSFTADLVGLYRAKLVVTDPDGVASAPATVDITVTDPNKTPVAFAGNNFSAPKSVVATLDGSGSYDPEGQALTYAWSFVSVPTGSTATLSSPGTVSPTFTPDLMGLYRARLVVTDAAGKSSPPSVVDVNVFDANQSPVANPGPWLTVARGAPVQLNGSASFDPEGGALTYAWTFVSIPTGSTATLTGANTATPSFTPDLLGTYTVRLVVTDPVGASSSPGTTTVDVRNGAPTAVIAGASPLTGLVNNMLALDASGSTDPDGDALSYSWSVASAPTGAGYFFTDPNASQPSFWGNMAGSYVLVLRVSDPSGNQGSAVRTLALSAASQLAIVSGNGQSGTVGTNLSAPMVVEARTAGGTAVPNAGLVWRIAGGALTTAPASTGSNGRASAWVRASRIAGAGSVTVWLAGQPSTAVTFNFTATAGPVTSLAVSSSVGNADTGAVVRVRTVDQYGNFVTSAGTASTFFALSVNGSATFAAAATSGNLISGGGTNSIQAQLVNGEFEIVLNDPVAQTVTVTLRAGSGGPSPVPFNGFTPAFFDNSEGGIGNFTLFNASPKWASSTLTASSGVRSQGLELAPSDAVNSGYSHMARGLMIPATATAVRLDVMHSIKTASAVDPQANCTAMPRFHVALRNAMSPFAGERAQVPNGGYPVTDLCSGGESLGSSAGTGWQALQFDLSDGIAAGYNNLFFSMTNNPSAVTPAQPSTWYVDDVLVSYLSQPAFAGTTNAIILPGAPASVEFSSGSYGWNGSTMWYTCWNSGIPTNNVYAYIRDANGNITQNNTLSFRIAYSGSLMVNSVLAGQVVNIGPNDVELRFQNGQAGVQLASSTNQTVTLSLGDPNGTGLTLGPNATGNFFQAYCHYNGISSNWTDNVPWNTYNVNQAMKACQVYYGIGNCTNDGTEAYRNGSCCWCYEYRWTFASVSSGSPCGPWTRNPGRVSGVYYTSGCWSGCTGTPGSMSISCGNCWSWN
ncbi:MAG: PKD domain-containing protein [Myxococcales bacterium]|nr:PKD domain-containing protein [Myxococcales bacterium]